MYDFRRGYEEVSRNVREAVITVPDFPKPGIQFRDITPVLKNPSLYRGIIEWLEDETCEITGRNGAKIDAVAAIEARGYLFGSPLAINRNLPFVLIRKPGKLPRETVRIEYQKEYGTDVLEVHRDDIFPGQNILIVDDVLATGETVAAAARLIESRGARVVATLFPLELAYLSGRKKLEAYPVRSLVVYE